ncbi:MAG TPA: very short patch repair endonuclease [Terriglobales bacterium]
MIRSFLHKNGYRFRLHAKELPGKPDLSFSGKRKAIFIHGCFWHQHLRCIDGRIPKSRTAYWKPKLERNKQRDSVHMKDLKKMGWRTLVVWECQVSKPATLKRVVKFLES